jgi:predicted enzyme related to lactoylglutathione lyase
MSGYHGKFVWYELMTTDTKAAETFYRSVIGWGAQDTGMPDMSYTLMTVGAIPVAGLMAVPQRALDAGARPSWTGYVAVDDVDARAAQAKQDGGAIHHPPDDIPGVGRFAVIADPQGASLCLFKSNVEPGQSPTSGAPGTAGWRELYTTDREAGFAFYAKLFGWTKAEHVDMGPMGIYQLFAAGGETIGGMMTKPPAVPRSSWTYYFNVDAVDAAAARVQAAGGQVLNGPHQVPGGSWIVQCCDPQGAMFSLVAPRR